MPSVISHAVVAVAAGVAFAPRDVPNHSGASISFSFSCYQRVMASSMPSQMEVWELLYWLLLTIRGIFSLGDQ